MNIHFLEFYNTLIFTELTLFQKFTYIWNFQTWQISIWKLNAFFRTRYVFFFIYFLVCYFHIRIINCPYLSLSLPHLKYSCGWLTLGLGWNFCTLPTFFFWMTSYSVSVSSSFWVWTTLPFHWPNANFFARCDNQFQLFDVYSIFCFECKYFCYGYEFCFFTLVLRNKPWIGFKILPGIGTYEEKNGHFWL